MLSDRLLELVRESGGDALLIDARNNKALVSDITSLILVLKTLRNNGFTRCIDYTGTHLGKDKEEREEFQMSLILRAPEHGHEKLILKWKWRAEGDNTHPSIASIWPACSLMEREIWEMLGIQISGNEQLRPLLLDEQFEGYPLRKDFKTEPKERYIEQVLKERLETSAQKTMKRQREKDALEAIND